MSQNNTQGSYPQVLDVIMAFYSERNYYNLLDTILVKMMEITRADGGTLYVRQGSQLDFCIMRNISQGIYQTAGERSHFAPIELDETNIRNVSAYAALHNQVVSIDDVYHSSAFDFWGPKEYDDRTGYNTRSMLVLPLTVNEGDGAKVVGVIQLVNATDQDSGAVTSFGEIFDPPVLPALSNICANALANVVYTQEIQQLFHSFVQVMATAIDERSPYSTHHTNNVVKYCGRFVDYLTAHHPAGSPLHFDANRREQLIMAAYLHDIGKIITPRRIMDKPDRLGEQLEIIQLRLQIKKEQLKNQQLRGELTLQQGQAQLEELEQAGDLVQRINQASYLEPHELDAVKALAAWHYTDHTGAQVPLFTPQHIDSLCIRRGTLTDAERLIMEEHVSVTGRLLDKMTFPQYYRNVPQWAKNHHEFWDGSGYPRGLSGEQLGIETAILTLADVFEALTASDRPYRKAMPVSRAVEILREMAAAGKFPPQLVELFAQSEIWNQ